MSKKQDFNLKLERYLLGELPPAEMAAMEGELKKNKPLRAQLENLKNETEAYYQKYPNLNRVNNTVLETRESWFKLLFAPRTIGGLAFAAACLFVVFFFRKSTPDKEEIKTAKVEKNTVIAMNSSSEENGVRVKGNKAALFLSALREAREQPLTHGDSVSGGEEIRIAYRASGFRYGVIVSIDADRSVTLHFPETKQAPQQLQSGGKTPLKLAFKLDDKPGFERFYFIASAEILPLNQIMQELAKSGKLRKQLPKDTNSVSIQLQKE